MSIPFSSQKRYLSEAFQGMITPEKVNAFRNKLVGLIRKHQEDPRFLTALKEVLEDLNQPSPTENLQDKTYSSGATQAEALHKTVESVALNILLPEKMKTMVQSTIRALESNDPSVQLQKVLSSEGFSMQAEPLSKEALHAIRLVAKKYGDSCEALVARLFQGVADREQRTDILRSIEKIPADQRIEIITKTESLFGSITDGYQKADVFRAIKEIPPKQRNAIVIQATARLFEGIEDGYRRAAILRAIGDIPATLRSDVIEKVVPFLEDVEDDRQRADILRAVGEIPEDGRSPDAVEATVFLLRGVEDHYRRADILRAVGEIPAMQRAGFLIRVLPSFLSITDGYERAELLRTTEKIPSDAKIPNAFQTMTLLLQGVTDELQKTDILRALRKIPSDRRTSTVIRAAIAIFQGVKSVDKREMFLRVIEEVLPSQRPDVFEKVASVFKMIAIDRRSPYMIDAIAKIPATQRADVIKKALPFFYGITESFETFILKAVRDVPEYLRFDVIEDIRSVLLSIPDGFERANILRAIAKIPKRQRTSSVMQATVFLFRNVGWFSDILEAVEKIPSDQRADVIEKASPVLLGISDGDRRIDILGIIAKIPSDQRTPFVIRAATSLFQDMDRFESRDILKVMEEMPASQRVDVIEKALPVFKSSTEASLRADILRIIAKIPSDQRTSGVVQMTASLLEGFEYKYERSCIFEAIEGVSADLRSDVIIKAFPMVKDVRDGLLISKIFQTVAQIPPDQRADVIEKSGPIFKGMESALDKPDILLTMQEIPADLRSDVVARTLPVLEGRAGGSRRSWILRSVGCISSDQRADVLEKAILLFRSSMDGYERVDILEAIKEMPANQRADVIEKSVFLFEDTMNGHHRASILRTIGILPEDQRADVMAKAVGLFGTTMGGHQRIEILQAISYIPADQRTFAVGHLVVSLLQGLENHHERKAVLKAFRKAANDRKIEAVQFSLSCKSLTKWDALTAYADIPSEEHFQSWKQVLLQLDKIHAPSLQIKTLVVFHRAIEDSKIRGLFESVSFATLFEKDHTQVFRLLIAYFWKDQLLDESLNAMAVVLNSRGFKDVDRKKIVLRTLTALSGSRQLNSIEKADVLRVIFSKDEIQSVPVFKKRLERSERLSDLQEQKRDIDTVRISPETEKDLIDKMNQSLLITEAICNLGRSAELKKIGGSEGLKALLESILKEILSLEGIPDFSDRYLKTFGSSRDPTSLSVYMGKLETLDLPEKTKALQFLTSYIEGVLTDTFASSRYEESASMHLAKVFEGRQALKRKWMTGRELDFEQVVVSKKENSVSRGFNAKEYLEQRVLNDGHISHGRIPYLAARLKGESLQEKDFFAEIQKWGQAVENDSQNQGLQRDFDLLRLQEGILSLLQGENEKQYEIFRSKVEPFIETALFEEEQFKSDLVGLGKMLAPRTKETSFSGWKVVDTDDPEDLLLCGTEVEGSCQSIHGNGSLNKCLLAYLLDGKNRLVAVKDGRGRIIARSILRILWDATRKVPVLFKERVYSSAHSDPKASEALNRMCILRAQELQLSLVAQSSSDPGASAYPNELESLGSKVPFEYSDAGDGRTNGTFKVKGVLLEDPYSRVN